MIVRYTKWGDADISGTVDLGIDFNQYLDGLNNSGTTWLRGDFDYSGTVDADGDFILYLTGFNN